MRHVSGFCHDVDSGPIKESFFWRFWVFSSEVPIPYGLDFLQQRFTNDRLPVAAAFHSRCVIPECRGGAGKSKDPSVYLVLESNLATTFGPCVFCFFGDFSANCLYCLLVVLVWCFLCCVCCVVFVFVLL